MRLIDADELLKEVIGIHDGWLCPSKTWRSIEDSIRNAPTINAEKELAQEIYDIIFNQQNYEWQLIHRTDNETAHHFSDILMKIHDLLKERYHVSMRSWNFNSSYLTYNKNYIIIYIEKGKGKEKNEIRINTKIW